MQEHIKTTVVGTLHSAVNIGVVKNVNNIEIEQSPDQPDSLEISFTLQPTFALEMLEVKIAYNPGVSFHAERFQLKSGQLEFVFVETEKPWH